jgi:hypothetical protein
MQWEKKERMKLYGHSNEVGDFGGRGEVRRFLREQRGEAGADSGRYRKYDIGGDLP